MAVGLTLMRLRHGARGLELVVGAGDCVHARVAARVERGGEVEGRRRRRGRLPGLPLALSAALVAVLAGGQALAQGRTVRVGIYQNEPKVFIDDDGRPAGIFVDLLEQIAKEEEWTLVYSPGTWDEGLEALDDGRIDLMPDVAFTEERAGKYGFHTTPIAESWSYVYAAPDSRIARLSQLEGKRVAVLSGSIQETIFRQMVNGFGIEATTVSVSSLKEAFRLVSDGGADGAIANHLFGDCFDQEYGLERTPIVFNAARLFFATARGRNTDLLAAIDEHMNAWMDAHDSVYYRTLNRYTAGEAVDVIPRWVFWIAGTIGGLLFAAGGLILLLRWKVRAKVRNLIDAERALHDSELKHRTLFEAASDAAMLMRGDRFIDCNARMLELFGCSREQIIGAPPYELSPPTQPDGRRSEEKAVEKINLALSEGPQVFEWEHCRRDGTPFMAEVRLNRLELDGETLLQAIVRDVTEDRRAQERLEESERKYRELVEHANSIILRWTHDGRVTFLNEFGQRFFGYSSEEIVGRHVMGTIVPTTDSDGCDLRRLMDQICADPIPFEQNVNENVRRNGERVWIAWTNKIVRDERGDVAEIFSVGTDITERKRAEEAIRALNAGLEQRVAERTAELAVAKEHAEAADRLKSAFLATMSHELRTPLNSIIGFSGILLQGLAGPLNEEQAKQMGMVCSSAEHLLALINDVLDISKIEAGQLQIAIAPFDLRDSIGKVVEAARPLAARRGLALEVGIAQGVGVIASDQRRVEQVLLNLLSNGIKFTERGGVRLEVRPTDGRIAIEVTDTGIGIMPSDMARLFKPFTQLDTGIDRQHEGTGLGLSICKRLVELLGGSIWVRSEWGEGSTFGFALPTEGGKE